MFAILDKIENAVKSLFGKGKIVFDVTLATGEEVRAKLAYVGDRESVNDFELHKMVRDEVYKRTGIPAVYIRLVGYEGY